MFGFGNLAHWIVSLVEEKIFLKKNELKKALDDKGKKIVFYKNYRFNPYIASKNLNFYD